jgi:hypothetical protein
MSVSWKMQNSLYQLVLILIFYSCDSATSDASGQKRIDKAPKQSEELTPQLATQKEKTEDQPMAVALTPIDLSLWPLDWVRLTETDSSTIIFESCDGGNMIITVDPTDSTLLFHGQQEDITYVFIEAGLASDSTLHFIFGKDKKQDVFTFQWIDKERGIGLWELRPYYLDLESHQVQFVSKQKEGNFNLFEQPCRECWDDEFCTDLETRGY